jgi:DNA primase
MSYKILKRYELFKKISPRHQLANDQVNLLIWCPFCQNTNKRKLKLSIHLEKCFYHCWICDKKGSNIPYLVKKINANYVAAAESLFEARNKKAFDLFEEQDKEEEINVDLPPEFMFLAESFNHISPDVKATLKYAISRGVNKHKLWMLRLGVSLNPEFSRMLILPSYDKNGKLNFYTGRKIDVDTKNSYKYKNALVPKKNIIFNELNLDFSLPLTIVEGPLDLIKTNDNATCLLGSSLTEGMKLFQEIVKNKTDVILALDDDAYDKAIKIAKNLSEYDINVKILNTSIAEDVGDMTTSQFKQIYQEAKEISETDMLLNKIRSL